VSEGALCAKGAAFHAMHVSNHRVLKPRYRAPGSDKWEEKDWDFVLDRIAHRVKETRDRDFMEKNAKANRQPRRNPFQLGTSQMDNENALSVIKCSEAWGSSISTIRPVSDTRPLYRLWQSRSDAAR